MSTSREELPDEGKTSVRRILAFGRARQTAGRPLEAVRREAITDGLRAAAKRSWGVEVTDVIDRETLERLSRADPEASGGPVRRLEVVGGRTEVTPDGWLKVLVEVVMEDPR